MSDRNPESSVKRLADRFGDKPAPFTPDHRDEAERALADEDTPLATAHALLTLADTITQFTRELRLNTLTQHRATLPPGSPSAITAREHIETELGL